MIKDFKTDIVNVLEDSKRSLTAGEIAEILSNKYNDNASVSPTKVLMRVKEHSDTFRLQREKISLKQKKSQKQKTVNELTSNLWNLFSYFRNSNFDNYEIFLSLLLYKRFEDTYSENSTKNLFNDYLTPLWKISNENDPSDLKAALYNNFEKLENNLSNVYEDYFELFDISENALNKIESDQLFNIVHDFSEFNFSKTRFSNEDFSEIYSELTDYLNRTGETKKKEGYYLPNEIFFLIEKFIQKEEIKKIYNPFVSEPNFFIKTLKEVFDWEKGIFFVGHAINQTVYSLALHNFVSLNYRNFKLKKGDSLLENEASDFDLAIAQLPFGKKKPKFDKQPNYLKYGDSRTSEWYYIQKMLNSVNEKGKVVAITSSSPLTNNSGSKIRGKLVQEGLVEAVIKLPDKLFKNTSVSPYIFILDKSQSHREIFLVDFSQKMDAFSKTFFRDLTKKAAINFKKYTEIEGFSRFITTEEVFSNRNSLDPSNYIHPELNKVKQFLASDKEKIFSLRSLIKDSVLGKYHSKKTREKEGGKFKSTDKLENVWYSSLPVSCVTMRDLKTQKNNVELQYSELEHFTMTFNDSKINKSIIQSKAVLVNRIGKFLHPLVFTPKYKNQHLLLGHDVVALIPDEELILPEYLHYQITQETTRVQVELKMRGVSIQRLNLRDLLDLKIFVPSIEEQEKQIFEFKKTLLKREKSEREYEEKENVIMANMRHSLKNQIGPIRNDLATTKAFLNNIEKKDKPFNWDMPIRPVIEEGEKVKTISEVFDRMDKKFDELNDILDKMKSIIDLNKSVLNFEVVKLGQFIRQVFDDLVSTSSNIQLKSVGEKIEAPIDKFWFKEAITNLIINAERHGKIENQDLELYFNISNTEDGNVRIYYANNGKPFPPGFKFDVQFKGFKEKAGRNGGSGLGGYLINKVIESHEGALELVRSDNEEPSYYTVELEMFIPKRI